jgi:hypothetical protein
MTKLIERNATIPAKESLSQYLIPSASGSVSDSTRRWTGVRHEKRPIRRSCPRINTEISGDPETVPDPDPDADTAPTTETLPK